ncbi:hypothetical protein P7F88_04385 [Vibrio hannami]|uniref:hypothetical protein n=1 Tax=Vibrio hannami TaxID=2717094 RepID=UPI00240F1634|nr:hypothetical protein [Vibrio hannami]MDG3085382.1 hypothetical protein [Vibrio hannami]
MEVMPEDTLEEFTLRLKWAISSLESINPDRAIPERKAFSYLGRGGTCLMIGRLLHLLRRSDEAGAYYERVIPDIRLAIASSLRVEEEIENQYALFNYALTTGNKEQATESANIIVAQGVQQVRMFTESVYHVAMAHLYPGKIERVLPLIPALKKLEEKKSEKFIKPGFIKAVTALCAKDVGEMAIGVTEMLEGHCHEARYQRWALNTDNLICMPVTVLAIMALRNGVDVKPLLTNSQTSLKTRTWSPADRPELPSTARFIVPVDLVPEFILCHWKEEPVRAR